VKGNRDIRPERQTEIEGGLDATFLRGRAALSVSLYQKTIDDLILLLVPAPSLGYTLEVRNAGGIRNRGTEALLTLTPIQSGPFSWVSRTTFARNVGIVTKLPVDGFNVNQTATGERVNFGSGYGQARLEVGKSVTAIIGADTLDPRGFSIKGDAAPDFTMGFQNELSWGPLRFTSLLDWQHGGDLVNVTQNVYDAYNLSPDQPDGGARRIFLNDTRGQAQYIYDASFVKLRELTLSYELPQRWVGLLLRGSAQSARLEFSGRNLYTWTDYPGVDPEVSNFGSQQISRFIDLAPFPPSRTYYFTISTSF
jgi:outer membrane cobalamin receptor